jgi:GntR family transcriptional regulator, transcriptional repressor for pyruvate dehydrogenase complex
MSSRGSAGPVAARGARARRGPNSHRPKKTAMLLAQRLVSEISDKELPPGTPLPSERVMLEEFQVARGSLREALRFLEIQGVISIKTGPGGGPVVAERVSHSLASIIAMFLQLDGAPFSDVLEARLVLEPALSHKAAERITDEQIAELGDSVKRMNEGIDDIDAFLDENDNFHGIIAAAAGNRVFGLVISSLNWISDGTPLGVDYPEQVRKSVAKEHSRIYKAIADRDGERAAAAMSVHIGDFAAYLTRFYPALVDAPLRWDQLE